MGDGWTEGKVILVLYCDGPVFSPSFLYCRSAGVFECELCLFQGRHEYKFLVDGHWRHDHTQVLLNVSDAQ